MGRRTTLTKAVEKDKTAADIVVGAKAPSEAWKIMTSMANDDSSERTKEQAKKNFKKIPASISQPRRSFLAFTPRGCGAIEGCTIQCKESPNRSPHVDIRYVPAFQL